MSEEKKLREKILDVKNLDITFETTAGKVHAIRGVNIDLYQGETVAIVGGPLFLMMSGIFIVALFLLQKNHSNFIVKDDQNIDQDTEEMSNFASMDESVE